jgi:hypothetical protein
MFPLKFYDAIAYGQINDAAFRLNGNGTFDQPNGRVNGLYEIEDLPPGIDALIFNAVLITGYPSVCKSSPLLTNPFQIGSYSYRREIAFDSGERLVYTADCSVVDSSSTLHSTFVLGGTVPARKLASTDPLTETWTPLQSAKIEGEFRMSWVGSDGQRLSGTARTMYSLPTSALPLNRRHTRSIQITNTRPTQNRFTVSQTSNLV